MTGIADDTGTRAWHRPLHHTRAGELDSDTAQTKGMKRFEALSARHGGTEQLWLGENHVGANMNSGDHHHGAAETGIYVVSGHPEFVFLEDGVERRIEAGPGDEHEFSCQQRAQVSQGAAVGIQFHEQAPGALD